MAVYKEINRADDSGVTTFYRISDILDTVETDDKEGQSVVIDYNQAQNKPSINGVALVGNKTSEDLGLQPAGDYITNNEADEKFIDGDELEAKNYVNQAELQDAIAHIEHFHREIVEALPVTGMDNVLYMVRKGGTGEDIYNEYIWVGLSNSENGYEFLGTTATDLTDYYKKSQVDAALATKVDKEGGKGLSEENYTLAEKTKLAGLKNYDDTEIQTEVSGLNTDMNNLKKSNVTISNTLAELKPDVDSNTAAVSTIYDLLDNKMTAIRLVEQGDGWVWMNLEGSRLTYAQASAALGHENCMLFIEQLENDGKVIPAEYKSDGDHINVIFKDLDSLVHIMTCGEDDVVVTKDVTTTNGQVDFTVEDEAIGYTTKMTALYGKSTQETRSGKNLLENKTKNSGISRGITFTLNGDGSYTLNGTNDGTGNSTVFLSGSSNPTTLKAGTYYTIPTPNGVQIVGAKIGGGYFQLAPSSTNQFTLNEDIQAQIYIQVPNGITTTYNNIKVYPMISITPITQSDYEPYGVMPSPDFPSPIESVAEISATVTGKNLFDINTATLNSALKWVDGTYSPENLSVASDFIKIEKGKSYISKYKMQIILFNENKEYIGYYKNTTGQYNGFTISTDSECNYVKVSFRSSSNNNVDFTTIGDIQIEQGSTATDYESFKSNSLTINLQGNELCSIGDVKDELVVENGRAKIIKRIGKVVLDGSETWYMDKELTNTVRFYTSEILTNKAKNAQPILSNYFITATSVNNINNDDNESAYVLNTTQPTIRINKSIANTLTTFKNWLSTHNVEVYYALETPIDIEITDPTLLAQLNALEQITQYKHTYITITGDDLTPEADFTYINNVVINNTDSVLGKDTYWNDEVPTQQDLPSKAQEGEIRIVQDTEDVYIYNGTKWVPFDKNSEVDLSNYLTKDNTTPWVPTGPFNPSTKKYVDDSVGGIHVPTKTSQLQNDSDFVIKTTNELTNYYTKNNTYTKNEVDALVAGGSGTSDYTTLSNKPSLDTTSDESLNPLKEEIDGEISLHKIAKTGNYKDLLYKPIIPITFTDNEKIDYTASELPQWQVSLLQQMINEYLQDNDSINNYILRADGIQYLEDSNSTFDVSMNYGKTESLFTFKKVGPYGSIPHAFQFVGSIIVNQKISKGSGYSSAAFRKNGIMIYCDENYKITAVCQRYKLYGGDKDNEGFFADYISTNDSYTTAYIPTKDYQPATKKYVDDHAVTESEMNTAITDRTKDFITSNQAQTITNNTVADYKLKGDFAVISGTSTITSGGTLSIDVDYPEGFNEYNTIPIAFATKPDDQSFFIYGQPMTLPSYTSGRYIYPALQKIKIRAESSTSQAGTNLSYILVIMKI